MDRLKRDTDFLPYDLNTRLFCFMLNINHTTGRVCVFVFKLDSTVWYTKFPGFNVTCAT